MIFKKISELIVILIFLNATDFSSCQSSSHKKLFELEKESLNFSKAIEDIQELYRQKIELEKVNDLKSSVISNEHNMYIKGILYENDKDYNKAMECYNEAAQLGHIKAQIMLAHLYYCQLGLAQSNAESKNYKTSFELFDDAADEGHWLAYYALSMCYYKGYGVDKDENQAIYYLNVAKSASTQVLKGI